VSRCPVFGSTTCNSPWPEVSTHSLPACQRGECDIAKPSATISFVGTSIRTPPVPLPGFQLLGVSLRPSAVTKCG